MLKQIRTALRKGSPVSRTFSMREPRVTKSDEVDSDDSLPKAFAKRVRKKTYATLTSVNFTVTSLPFFRLVVAFQYYLLNKFLENFELVVNGSVLELQTLLCVFSELF